MKQSHITHTAKASGVTRHTLYHWIEKGCIKHKRYYRNYPVFTKDDIEGIKSSRERSWRFNMMPVGPLIYEGNRRNLFF
jgi:predicted site-specific integrase-resolvase